MRRTEPPFFVAGLKTVVQVADRTGAEGAVGCNFQRRPQCSQPGSEDRW
jgi:hypothetical protein